MLADTGDNDTGLDAGLDAGLDDGLDDGLADYDRLRRPRTQNLVRASARVARLANARHRVTAWLRDTAARALPASAYLSASTDTFAWQPPTRAHMRATDGPSIARPGSRPADAG